MQNHGGTENLPVRESLIVHGDYTIQGGVQGMETLVQENPDMTAVFITNYEMTMGAVIGMNELGLRIPEQLSMIGFDNLPFARACNPKLTIVAQPTDRIAGGSGRDYAGNGWKGLQVKETEPIPRRSLAQRSFMENPVRALRMIVEKQNTKSYERHEPPYLLGIDIGTSACKVAVFEKSAVFWLRPTAIIRFIIRKEGWAEQNPEEWWSAVCQAVKKAIQKRG